MQNAGKELLNPKTKVTKVKKSIKNSNLAVGKESLELGR